MLLICVYLLVLLIVIILVFYSRKEGFNQLTTTVSPETTSVNPPTKSSLEEMDLIDFSEIENSEKILRDVQSNKLNSCIGKYVNRRVKPLRDVSEIMFSKVEDCDNIFDATMVENSKDYFEQMNYW
tara:strand:- start:163 stop:540 length:378 start_codon:yes stop_codon:yes gene_type:complete